MTFFSYTYQWSLYLNTQHILLPEAGVGYPEVSFEM